MPGKLASQVDLRQIIILPASETIFAGLVKRNISLPRMGHSRMLPYKTKLDERNNGLIGQPSAVIVAAASLLGPFSLQIRINLG